MMMQRQLVLLAAALFAVLCIASPVVHAVQLNAQQQEQQEQQPSSDDDLAFLSLGDKDNEENTNDNDNDNEQDTGLDAEDSQLDSFLTMHDSDSQEEQDNPSDSTDNTAASDSNPNKIVAPASTMINQLKQVAGLEGNNAKAKSFDSFLALYNQNKNAAATGKPINWLNVMQTINSLTAQSAHAVAMCHAVPALCGLAPKTSVSAMQANAASSAFGGFANPGAGLLGGATGGGAMMGGAMMGGMGGMGAVPAAYGALGGGAAAAATGGFNIAGGSTGMPNLVSQGGIAAPGMFPNLANAQSPYDFSLRSAGLGGIFPDPSALRSALTGPTNMLESRENSGSGVYNPLHTPYWWGKYPSYMDADMAKLFAKDDDKNQWRIGGEPWAMLHAGGEEHPLFPHGAPKAKFLPQNAYPDPGMYPQYYRLSDGKFN